MSERERYTERLERAARAVTGPTKHQPAFLLECGWKREGPLWQKGDHLTQFTQRACEYELAAVLSRPREEKEAEAQPRPCVVCGKLLEPVNETWENMQPYEGCEIQVIAAFGSRKLDFNVGATSFRGVVCDDCAERLVANMERAN